MGADIACVQVYLGDQHDETARKLVIEAVRRGVQEGPFVEVTETDDVVDRIVQVSKLGDAPWLTVIDRSDRLYDLAQYISKTLQATTVVINLVDSDVLHLRRYHAGNVVDDYCNAPHNSYGIGQDLRTLVAGTKRISKKQLAALTHGDLTKWRDLAAPSADFDMLRQMWDSTPVFADDILWETTDALAMNADDTIVTHENYTNFTHLAFQLTTPRPTAINAGGPPQLELTSYQPLSAAYPLYTGQLLDISISVRNTGSRDIGLDIIAWGGSITQQIITLQKAVIGPHNRADENDQVPFGPDIGDVSEQAFPIMIASFPNLELPQGIVSSTTELWQSDLNWAKAQTAIMETHVGIRVLGSVERDGTGDLCIAVVPHANREQGAAVYQGMISSIRMPRKPLRYNDQRDPYGTLMMLHKLETPTYLFALVSLGLRREACVDLIADLVEEWLSHVVYKKTDRLTIILETDVDLSIEKHTFVASTIPKNSRWVELRKKFQECVSFSIKHKRGRITFDINPLSFQTSGEIPAPHVRFSYLTTDFTEDELESIQDWLTQKVDALMTEGAGLQAILGRWDWQETQHVDMTPYELACGIVGQCTTAQFWCTQFLRAVTSQLWLGPEILVRLADIAQLATIATLLACGGGIRVMLNNDATLDELEQTLAPLLPSIEDWKVGMERLYPMR